ncbi:MAG: division/cell wall cluster transcriptional repressor MraZ [Actinomycetota bacterium]
MNRPGESQQLSFMGRFRHTIDAKGRLIVPSRMRDEIAGDKVVLSWWFEDCIAIWSETGWNEIETRLRSIGQSGRGARQIVRKVAGSAHAEEVDKQGRVNIPQTLRDEAGITREAVIVGSLTHGEIWDPVRYEQRNEQVDEGQLEELAEGLDF